MILDPAPPSCAYRGLVNSSRCHQPVVRRVAAILGWPGQEANTENSNQRLLATSQLNAPEPFLLSLVPMHAIQYRKYVMAASPNELSPLSVSLRTSKYSVSSTILSK